MDTQELNASLSIYLSLSQPHSSTWGLRVAPLGLPVFHNELLGLLGVKGQVVVSKPHC